MASIKRFKWYRSLSRNLYRRLGNPSLKFAHNSILYYFNVVCDTLIALPSLTEFGKTIFAKNTHREANEAQAIIRVPRTKHSTPTVQCTYKTIPQVSETYEVVIAKSFCMWGAEMGVNEFSVIIGNSIVFTKMPIQKGSISLTGMDLVRLGLERSKNAKQALQIITELLTEHGSDGCHGYENKDLYGHNSFIIADRYEAWVLETAGREWAAEKIKDCRTISNGLTIGEKFDLISPTAIETAKKNKLD